MHLSQKIGHFGRRWLNFERSLIKSDPTKASEIVTCLVQAMFLRQRGTSFVFHALVASSIIMNAWHEFEREREKDKGTAWKTKEIYSGATGF